MSSIEKATKDPAAANAYAPEQDSKLPMHQESANQPAWRMRLWEEVDSKQTTWMMVWACFLTGFTSAVSFTVSCRPKDKLSR
jgi:hypothetical protein